MPAPPFGTAAAYTDSFPSPPPPRVTISAETCFNLSVFKGTLRLVSLIHRLNARYGQTVSQAGRPSYHPPQSGECTTTRSGPSWAIARIWLVRGPASGDRRDGRDVREDVDRDNGYVRANPGGPRCRSDLAAGWAHRQTLLSYCLNTVQSSIQAKRKAQSGIEEKLVAPAHVPSGPWRRGVKEEEVLVGARPFSSVPTGLHRAVASLLIYRPTS